MLLKAIPSTYSNPYKHAAFTEVTPISHSLRDETYPGNYTQAREESAVAILGAPSYKGNYFDMAYSGYDVSSIPKSILNSVSFKCKIMAFDGPNQWSDTNSSVREAYMILYSGGKEIFRADLRSGEYDLGLNYSHRVFSIDLTGLVTLDELQDFTCQFYVRHRYNSSTSQFLVFGSSLNIDYTPLHELHIPTTNFIAPFKNEPIEYATAESYNWNITKAFSLPDEDNYSAELIFPNGKVGDGYFCGFDISSIPEHSPIFEAYFKVRILAKNSRNTNRYYKAYSSVAELNSVSIPSEDGTYIIPIPNPKRELLQDARLVMEAAGSGSNSFDNVYGVELYVAYGDPLYDWLPGYASSYVPEDYCGFNNFANCCDEPSTVDTYAEILDNQQGSTTVNYLLKGFAYPTLEPDAKIIGIRMRFSYLMPSLRTVNPHIEFKLKLGNVILCQTPDHWIRSDEKDIVFSNTLTYDKDINLKQTDLSDIVVDIEYSQSSQLTAGYLRIFGVAVDLLTSTDAARPEWYPVIETIVKSGNLTLDFTAAKPSLDVSVNDVPDTEGYIGNLYNDDLNDYAEFNYTPVPDENGVMPEDRPDFETVNLGVIRIDSPELTSLGIPGDAVITNIKLTKETLKHCTLANPSAELALYINDNKYDAKGFNISTSFTKTTYDTGTISIPKLEIRNDKAYFMLKWNSLNTPFTFKVKYLLWDITYELGGKTFTLQFAQENIDKMILGQAEVKAVYAGALKIYG